MALRFVVPWAQNISVFITSFILALTDKQREQLSRDGCVTLATLWLTPAFSHVLLTEIGADYFVNLDYLCCAMCMATPPRRNSIFFPSFVSVYRFLFTFQLPFAYLARQRLSLTFSFVIKCKQKFQFADRLGTRQLISSMQKDRIKSKKF